MFFVSPVCPKEGAIATTAVEQRLSNHALLLYETRWNSFEGSSCGKSLRYEFTIVQCMVENWNLFLFGWHDSEKATVLTIFISLATIC
mmetsp:Transcript_11778/g.14667  ORF Transcript_11778/g.14667 Transcript_11778/m.14667 type:complete len:88 (+) Transcript_11778:396-659(+)